VKLHICGNTSRLMSHIVTAGADLINVDHMVDFSAACDVYGAADICFKGNLDPVADLLQGAPDRCQQRVQACLRAAAGRRYMLSAGCEVPAATTDEVFAAFCSAPQLLQSSC
jgi:uroporphyrinogen-III decarboxylase